MTQGGASNFAKSKAKWSFSRAGDACLDGGDALAGAADVAHLRLPRFPRHVAQFAITIHLLVMNCKSSTTKLTICWLIIY